MGQENAGTSSPDLSMHAAEVGRLDEKPTEGLTHFEVVEEVPPAAEPAKRGRGRPRKMPPRDYKAEYNKRKNAVADLPEEGMVDAVLGLPPEELRAFFDEVLEVMIDEAHRQLEWSRPSEMWKLRMVEIHAKLAMKYLGDKASLLSEEFKYVIYAALWVVPQTAAHWQSPGMLAIRQRVSNAISFFLRRTKRNRVSDRTQANGQDHTNAEVARGTAASSAN